MRYERFTCPSHGVFKREDVTIKLENVGDRDPVAIARCPICEHICKGQA